MIDVVDKSLRCEWYCHGPYASEGKEAGEVFHPATVSSGRYVDMNVIGQIQFEVAGKC